MSDQKKEEAPWSGQSTWIFFYIHTATKTAKNPELVEHEEFARSFRSSPTHADLLSDIPVSLVSDQESGLWGAAYAALQSN